MSDTYVAQALWTLVGRFEQFEKNADERQEAVLQRFDEKHALVLKEIEDLRLESSRRLDALEARPGKTRKQFAAVVTGCMALATGIVTLLSKFGFHA